MNDDKNLTGENQQSEEEPTNEKIPLWLQGLDDEAKDQNPEAPLEKAKTDDSWMKEHDQHGDDLIGNGDDLATTNKEIHLPDWIREDSEIVDGEAIFQDISDDNPDYSEVEDIPKKVSSTEIELDDEQSSNEPTDHGFIDISELNMDDTREPMQFIPIEEEDVNEELPAWLHDMINDQPDQPVFQDENAQMEGQIREESEGVSTNQIAERHTDEQPWQEIPTSDNQSFPGPERDLIGEKLPEHPVEDITKPVQIEPGTSDEWVQVDEFIELPEDLDPFERAESMLDDGTITPAIELLTQELASSPSEDYSTKLQTLIDSFAGRSEKIRSALLELQGDIALNNNDPSSAFQAYAQALESLLSDKEVTDGTY